MYAFCLIFKEEINRCNLMSSMYNSCINKFNNVLIYINKVKANYKRIKMNKLVKRKNKKNFNDAEFKLSSKNLY